MTSEELFNLWLNKMKEDKSLKEEFINIHKTQYGQTIYTIQKYGRQFMMGFNENGFCVWLDFSGDWE